MPMRASGASWNASCATPPMNTPQASALIGGSKYFARKIAAPMIDRLSTTGVNAGTAKRR